MRPLVVVLLIAAASLAAAVDEPAAPLTTPAPTPAVEVPAPAAAPWLRRTLSNPNCELEISTFRASIARFALTGIHPTRIPEWKRERLNLPVVERKDREAPLNVLDRFNLTSDMHGFLSGAPFALLDGKLAEGSWHIADGADSRHVVMTSGFQDAGYAMSYRLDDVKPEVTVELTITNGGSNDLPVAPTLRAIDGIHQDDPTLDAQYLVIAVHRGGDAGGFDTTSVSGLKEFKPLGDGTALDYVAMRDRFFAVLWTPRGCSSGAPPETADHGLTTQDPAMVLPALAGSNAGRCSLAVSALPFAAGTAKQALIRVDYRDASGKEFVLKPTQKLTLSWSLAVTSLRKADLALFSDVERQVEYTDGYYRFFKSLAKLLTVCLGGLALVVRNYGVALILLTFLLKLALHRFTVKQMTSMMKMQKLAPQLKYLQEQYKGDRQQLAMKQMEMYKKHGVNPLGGCLPMLVQIPVFIALYQAFLHSAEMRGQSFLWVADLTMPDQVFGFANPYLSWLTINPLPIIYIAATVWMSFSQKMPSGGDPTQEQTMKMMRWMPVFFGVIFYNMSAGLVLYFTTNAILSTIETRMVRRRLGMDQTTQQPTPVTR